MNNKQINMLVLRYKKRPSDEDFSELYKAVSEEWVKLQVVAQSVRANIHEITAVYEDTLLKAISEYSGEIDFIKFYRLCVSRARTDLYRKKKRIYHREVHLEPPLNSDGSQAATYDPADDFNLEDYVTAKKKADQRQLIDSLLNGADETTTVIVETFLSHPKPTATAIANELGVHHSKVTRALHRLSAKFDPKQYGSHHDYLVAL
ncbi:hypothetical protein [Mesobacillus zeae]|uniref:hypothetical protein n=1 Tax=Mesobacillus zeae TaxID=1917180 RepID=UPI003008E849